MWHIYRLVIVIFMVLCVVLSSSLFLKFVDEASRSREKNCFALLQNLH